MSGAGSGDTAHKSSGRRQFIFSAFNMSQADACVSALAGSPPLQIPVVLFMVQGLLI